MCGRLSGDRTGPRPRASGFVAASIVPLVPDAWPTFRYLQYRSSGTDARTLPERPLLRLVCLMPVRRFACNGFADLLPLWLRRIPRGTTSSASAVLRSAAVQWMQSADRRLTTAIEAAQGGFGQTVRSTRTCYYRQLPAGRRRIQRRDRTLSLQAKKVRIVPDTRASGENAPSHRVLVDRVEFGAGWSKSPTRAAPISRLKLDDPSFTVPIYANVVADEGGQSYSLIWSRPNRRNGD